MSGLCWCVSSVCVSWVIMSVVKFIVVVCCLVLGV